MPAAHRPDDEVAADLAVVAALFEDGEFDRRAQPHRDELLHALRALGTAKIRRHDGHGMPARLFDDLVCKQRRRFEQVDAAAERVFERRDIVHVHHHHVIDAHGFQQLRDVTRVDRITLLGATVLARIGDVGKAGRDARCAGVLQCRDQEQDAAETIIGAARLVATQRLDHVDDAPADADQRPGFVLAAFVIALFERRKRGAEARCDALAEGARRKRREKQRRRVDHDSGVTAPLGPGRSGDRLFAQRRLAAQRGHALLQLAACGIKRIAQDDVHVLVPVAVGTLHVDDDVAARER